MSPRELIRCVANSVSHPSSLHRGGAHRPDHGARAKFLTGKQKLVPVTRGTVHNATHTQPNTKLRACKDRILNRSRSPRRMDIFSKNHRPGFSILRNLGPGFSAPRLPTTFAGLDFAVLQFSGFIFCVPFRYLPLLLVRIFLTPNFRISSFWVSSDSALHLNVTA